MNQASCDVIQTTPKVLLEVSDGTITKSRANKLIYAFNKLIHSI